MTADQLVKPLQIIGDVQQRKLTDAVMTPDLRRAMKDARASVLGSQLREQLQQQVNFQRMFRPALLEQIREQNEIFSQMLDTPGVRSALATIDFKLPAGLADQVAAYREHLLAEFAGDSIDPDVAEERAGRLAEERQAIIKCLYRIGIAVEGFSYLPESPIPPLVGFLILLLAALGEVADEILTEREADE